MVQAFLKLDSESEGLPDDYVFVVTNGFKHGIYRDLMNVFTVDDGTGKVKQMSKVVHRLNLA